MSHVGRAAADADARPRTALNIAARPSRRTVVFLSCFIAEGDARELYDQLRALKARASAARRAAGKPFSGRLHESQGPARRRGVAADPVVV